MTKKSLKIIHAVVFVAAMFMAPSGIYAQSSTPDARVQQQPTDNVPPDRTDDEPSEARTMQMNDQACRAVEENAVNHMGRLADFTERQLELFSTIAERVDEFYQQNELQAEGYDEHMDNIESLTADAESLTDELRESTDSFECGQENVSQHIGDFRTSLQESKNSLESLRQAVREQILLVKGALSDTSTTDEDEETLETSETENGQE